MFKERDWIWSYKKLEKKPAPALINDSLRSLLQVATIQNSIHDKGVEIIFIDEFSINTRHQRFCRWSKKNRRGYINIQSRDFSMSFILAVSKMNVYGFFGSEQSITSKEVKYYIKQLVEWRKEHQEIDSVSFILMYGNAKVHTSEEVWDFI